MVNYLFTIVVVATFVATPAPAVRVIVWGRPQFGAELEGKDEGKQLLGIDPK